MRRDEAEFLPAVLEIQESPPSPLGRAVLLVVILLFAAGIAWATLSHIDTVAVARGKLVPGGRSKVIQPLESGIIRAIRVRDGQAVRKGAVLIELDPTPTTADYQRLSSERLAAQVQVARLRGLLADQESLPPVAGADAALVGLQEQLLRDQRAEHAGRLRAAQLLIEQRQAAVGGTRAEIARLEMLVPMFTERAEAFKKLLAGEFIARLQYLEVEAQRVT
ncbi:MAG TPA: HlyD family type I secretion periplasmic adaptor subunit, partial [Candidatus Rokubacteria bacterium]|nr:HlyD family type I secretion periplasmic adaptor subunit [Candidatus Rokubacteria bacterium]